MIRALIFDLDDTLYPEIDFVVSGYQAVAGHAAATFGLDPDRLLANMVETLEQQGRKRVFPVLLESFPAITLSIPELVALYRQHPPDIRLYPGYPRLLENLACRYPLGIITDGWPQVQRQKVRALGLDRVMDRVLYTWDYGSEKEKPHPLPFRLMLQWLHAEPASSLFVGDNPEKDGRGALAAGMQYAHVDSCSGLGTRLGSRERDPAELRIRSLHQLPKILQDLN